MGHGLGKILGIRTDHRTNDPLRIDIFDFFLAGDFSVAQNGDVIADPHQFFETMRNIDDCHPLAFQFSNHLEQNIHFGCGKCRSRLVHDDDACIERNGLGDFDELLLSDGQIGHKRICADACIKPVEILAGFCDLRPVINAPQTACNLACGKDILCHSHV